MGSQKLLLVPEAVVASNLSRENAKKVCARLSELYSGPQYHIVISSEDEIRGKWRVLFRVIPPDFIQNIPKYKMELEVTDVD